MSPVGGPIDDTIAELTGTEGGLDRRRGPYKAARSKRKGSPIAAPSKDSWMMTRCFHVNSGRRTVDIYVIESYPVR